MNESGESCTGIVDTVLRCDASTTKKDAEVAMYNSDVVEDDRDENFVLQASIETSFDGSPEVVVTSSRRSADYERSWYTTWGETTFSDNRTIESVDKIERYIELDDFANGGGVLAWEWAATETKHGDFFNELLSLPQTINCHGTADSFQIPKEIAVGG